MKIIPLGARKKHVCTVCGKEFYWGDDCYWFGILEDKNGKEVIKEKCCSSKCKSRSQWIDENE